MRHWCVAGKDGGETALDLTLTEFRLLAHLARTPKRVFSRGELLETCLPEGEALERTVDSHLSKLRKKLAEATGGQNYIETVWGRGYVLRDPSPVDLDRRFAMGA